MGNQKNFTSHFTSNICSIKTRKEAGMSVLSAIFLLCLCTSSLAQKESASADKRNGRLFFVSSSSTTSTVLTNTICFSAATGFTACGRKKRRSIELSGEDETEASPTPVMRNDEAYEEEKLESGVSESAEDREGRFLLYWLTTTSTSATTSYTGTSTLATLECPPSGFSLSACG